MENDIADSAHTQRLLTRIREGLPQALEQLLGRYRSYLQQLIELRLGGRIRARVDASDIVQNTQLEAARRLATYLDHPRMPFKLWLRRIACDQLIVARRRHVRSARRGSKREVPLPAETSVQLGRQLLAGGTSPSRQIAQAELARLVREALGRLSEADRDVLLMRNFEGLTNQEVAQVLQVDEPSASRRYGRALRHLRARLVESGITESQL